MKMAMQKTVLLGDLIATEFDKAALFSADPQQVSHRAVRSIRELMRQTRDRLARRRAGAAFAASHSQAHAR